MSTLSGMTNQARTAEQIIADGARPEAAAQQAQLERWISGHEQERPADDYVDYIVRDEIDAYAADGFMSSNPATCTVKDGVWTCPPEYLEGHVHDYRPGITQAEALEERFGPLPVRVPGRAQKIAAIHALADWFAAHPDVPMPVAVQAVYYITPQVEPADDVRHRDYRAVREALDGRSYPVDNIGKLDRNFQFTHYPPMSTADMQVTYLVAYLPRDRDGWTA
jgi:hypothetical protein